MKAKNLAILILMLIVVGFSSTNYLIGTIGYQQSSSNLALVSFSPYLSFESFIFKLTFPAYIDSNFSLKSFAKWDDTIDYVGYRSKYTEIAITKKSGYFRDFFDTSVYEFSEDKYVFLKMGTLFLIKGLYGIDTQDRYASIAANFNPLFIYLDYNNGDVGLTSTYSLKPIFLTANYYSNGSISLGAAMDLGGLNLVAKYYYNRPQINFGLSVVKNVKFLLAVDAKDVGLAITNTGNYLLYVNSNLKGFGVYGVYQKDSYDLNFSYKLNDFQFYTHIKPSFMEVGVNILLL